MSTPPDLALHPQLVSKSVSPMYARPTPPPQSMNYLNTGLFELDANGNTSVSQPLQPSLPRPASGNHQPGSSTSMAARSLSYRPSTTISNHGGGLGTPTTNTNENPYYTLSRDPQSPYAASGHYLDPSSQSPGVDLNAGFSGNTTPGFDTVDDMPPMADDSIDLYGSDEPVGATSSTTAEMSTGYPPSPRATISPKPIPNSQGLTSELQNSGLQKSPIVKVEEFSPLKDDSHATPRSQETSYSSSSGFADKGTVRREKDGFWKGGLDPDMRAIVDAQAAVGVTELPLSLKERDLEIAVLEKRQDVEEWLKRTTSIESAQAVNASNSLTVKNGSERRSRSVCDFPSGPWKTTSGDSAIAPEESGANNAETLVEDPQFRGDYDYEDDSPARSSFAEGSLDEPATEEALRRAEQEEAEREQRQREADPANLPDPRRFYSQHPWHDLAGPITRGASMAMKSQPATSNAAIMRFMQYADNIETASRAATFGSNMSKSRRLSAGDADKILVDGGLFKRLSFGRDKQGSGKEKERKSSMWEVFTPNKLKRGLSNAGDRDKEKEKADSGTAKGSESSVSTGSGVLTSPKPRSSFRPQVKRGRGQPPKTDKALTVDTSIGSALARAAGVAAGAGGGSAHPTTSTTSPSPGWSVPSSLTQMARRRSKSDLSGSGKLQKQKSHQFGLVTMLGSVGGPPMLPIKSPVGSSEGIQGGQLQQKFTFGPETRKRGTQAINRLLSPDVPAAPMGIDDDDDEDMEDDDAAPSGNASGPGARPQMPKLDIKPTFEGFAEHARTLNPQLGQKLVDRIAHEQSKRYRKLVEQRKKHLAAIENGKNCCNGVKCKRVIGAVGIGGCGVVTVNGHKRVTSVGSNEGGAYSSDETVGDGAHSPSEGNAAAQFPPGVPNPPVSRLPAEFECPICFKVKKFNKPSDWTKHVHEDVQPFTCTFPDCTEPKSFKRKADWVRHENERHRHLEWWRCNIPDCTHICYRKDNFVQHLVREHKMAEPKVKAQKAAKPTLKKNEKGKKGGSGEPTQEDIDKVWETVEACHQWTNKVPNSEKCRFCGNFCSTWKKLTVHLARHMEQISLPILDLIKDDAQVPASTKLSGGRANRRIQDKTPATVDSSVVSPPAASLSQDMEIDPVAPQTNVSAQYSTDAEYQRGSPSFTSPVQPDTTPFPTHSYDMSHSLQNSPPQPRAPTPQDQYNIQVSSHPSSYPDMPTALSSHSALGSMHGINNPQIFLAPAFYAIPPSNVISQGNDFVPASPPNSSPHNNHFQQPCYGTHSHSPSPQPQPILSAQQPPFFGYPNLSGQAQGPHNQMHLRTISNTQRSLIQNQGHGYNFYAQDSPGDAMEMVGQNPHTMLTPAADPNEFGYGG